MAKLSYSQVNSWLDCPERYRLERIVKVPVPPAWYLVGGKAVHNATERVDAALADGLDYNVQEVWRLALELAVTAAIEEDETETPIPEWRMSRNHGLDWWAANGLRMVNTWVDWRLSSGWRLLLDDQGGLGIEQYIEGSFGHHIVRGYIDRVMITPDGEPVVLDIKTGQAPKFPLQLGIYAVLLRRAGLEVQRGAYFLAEKGELVDIDLTGWTEEVVSRYVLSLGEAVDKGEYLPHPGIFCGTCPVRPHCSVGSLLYLPPPAGKKPALKPITRKETE